jgi:TonB family protein
MTVYILQVCLGILMSWIAYKLFLKKRASARTNRVFLNFGLVLPFIVPFIPLRQNIVTAIEPLVLPVVNVTNGGVFSTATASTINWLFIAYAIGVIAFVLYHLQGVLVFANLKRNAIKEQLNIYRTTSSIMPFSFFGSIFLPKGLSKDQEDLIVQHEQWHIRLYHSWDVTIGAIAQSVLWFFPLLPFYIKDLRQEHEFEVDEKMLNETSFQTYAETLLHVSLMPIQHAKFHSFSAPTLKTRLIMMTKTQKNNTWKLLFFIPLVGSLFYLNACTKQTEAIHNGPEAILSNQVETPPQFKDCQTTEDKSAMMQCFMGGVTKQIIDNFEYPKEAANANVVGTIFVEITIDQNGELTNKKIARTIESDETTVDRVAEMETAALNVFNDFPSLIPATKEGKDVSVKYTIPIKFALE